MQQGDSFREGDAISPFALVAQAVRRDSLLSNDSLGSSAPTSGSEYRQQSPEKAQNLGNGTPPAIAEANSLSAFSPFAQQALVSSSNASLQGTTITSGTLSQEIPPPSERTTSPPSGSEHGEQPPTALVVTPLTSSPVDPNSMATPFQHHQHLYNHLPSVPEIATEEDKTLDTAPEADVSSAVSTPRAPGGQPPAAAAATAPCISGGGAVGVAQLLASLPQSQLPPRSPYSPGYPSQGLSPTRLSPSGAPASPMRRSGPSMPAPALAAPVTNTQLQMAALQALQTPANPTAAQRLQMQQQGGGAGGGEGIPPRHAGAYTGTNDQRIAQLYAAHGIPLQRNIVEGGAQGQGVGPRNGSAEALSSFFPAARYSLSLDSMRSSLSEEGANVASAIAADVHRRQRSRKGGRQDDQAAALIQQMYQNVQKLPKVRALVSTGGQFKHAPQGAATGAGGVPYVGGEVRLVNLPEGCSYLELVSVLAKTERTQPGGGGSSRGGSSGSHTQSNTTSAINAVAALLYAHAEGIAESVPRYCLVRYQLPSDQSVIVDILDDEDVRLMFEEQTELRARQGITAPKLHLYVQWAAPRGNIFSGGSDDALMNSAYSAFPPGGSSSSLESDDLNSSYQYSYNSPGGGTGARQDSLEINMLGELGLDENQHGYPSRRLSAHSARRDSSFAHAAHRSASDLRLAAVRTDQLEAISAKDVILTTLMGSGTVGDMYKGTWRSCDVAVKVLNPAAVGLKYTSRSAWLSFLEDANQMGALRHPNLVEVYGIVLPGSLDVKRQPSLGQSLGQSGHSSDFMGCNEAEPAAMGGRRTSWDFGAGIAPLRSSGSGVTNLPAHGIQHLPGPVSAPPAIVMELVSGRSLYGAIERREDSVAGKLTRVVYALDVARGMAYLHSKGTVLTSYTPGVTMSRGVLPWVAPEVLRSPERVGQKSDVYAFGVILWELWALRAPYTDEAYRRLVSALVNSEEVVRPTFPGEDGTARAEEPAPGWKSLVERCWAEDPDARPVFSDIVEELREMAKVVKDAQRVPGAATKVTEVVAGKGMTKAVVEGGQ